MTAECRSCHAPIIWAKTEAGKAMPLDASPVLGGEWIVNSGDCYPVKAAVLPEPTAYRSHFATCPNAALAGTTRTIAEIREYHPEHVRSGYRCDCTHDLLLVLDHVAARLAAYAESRPLSADEIRELIEYIAGATPTGSGR